MNLRELINTLATLDENLLLPKGFCCPHSYRGYYNELAFVPTTDVTVGQMIESAENAVGNVYTGWKGGEYTMFDDTPVWLAFDGSTGHEITQEMIAAWVELAAGNVIATVNDTVVVDDLPPVYFSVNSYDQDGDVVETGVRLHFGGTSIVVANNPREFKKFVKRIQHIEREIDATYTPGGDPL